MSDSVIALKDVTLTLEGNAGPVNILRGVSMHVGRGETLGLVGPSGSGKSSLLMLMGGLETATGGSVMVLGQDLTAMNEDALARFRRGHMGVVFHSFHLIPTMTAIVSPKRIRPNRLRASQLTAMTARMAISTQLSSFRPHEDAGPDDPRC